MSGVMTNIAAGALNEDSSAFERDVMGMSMSSSMDNSSRASSGPSWEEYAESAKRANARTQQPSLACIPILGSRSCKVGTFAAWIARLLEPTQWSGPLLVASSRQRWALYPLGSFSQAGRANQCRRHVWIATQAGRPLVFQI